MKCFIRFIDESERKNFNQSRCMFSISVGQQSHEGEFFSKTIDLINANFKSCVMIVDDSLQRHTMALEHSQDADYFYNISIREGDLWLERNRTVFERLNSLEKVVRWDYWLKHKEFNARKAIIESMIATNAAYAEAFNVSIQDFVEKYRKRNNNINNADIDRAKKLSYDFVLEECTALCLWTELECNYEVYHGLHNEAMRMTKEIFIFPNRPNLLKAVTLGFRNYKQLERQKFYCLE